MQITPRKPMRGYLFTSLFSTGVLLGVASAISILTFASNIEAQIQQPGLNDQPPPSQAPVQPENARPGENLSEQLGRSQGVIAPPTGVDPKIETPAPEPNPGTTRVIPPPGSPGGDPNVQPK